MPTTPDTLTLHPGPHGTLTFTRADAATILRMAESTLPAIKANPVDDSPLFSTRQKLAALLQCPSTTEGIVDATERVVGERDRLRAENTRRQNETCLLQNRVSAEAERARRCAAGEASVAENLEALEILVRETWDVLAPAASSAVRCDDVLTQAKGVMAYVKSLEEQVAALRVESSNHAADAEAARCERDAARAEAGRVKELEDRIAYLTADHITAGSARLPCSKAVAETARAFYGEMTQRMERRDAEIKALAAKVESVVRVNHDSVSFLKAIIENDDPSVERGPAAWVDREMVDKIRDHAAIAGAWAPLGGPLDDTTADDIVGRLVYRGNTVSWIFDKMRARGNAITKQRQEIVSLREVLDSVYHGPARPFIPSPERARIEAALPEIDT